MSRDYRQFKKVNYNFSRAGAIGSFSPDKSQPLEFIMTSMKIDDIMNLTFARDIQENKKDFDALIQRDIDEDRARRDICNYLVPKEGIANGVVFLPPLIVSIIEVDDTNKIKNFYPDLEIHEEDDDFGGSVTREWKGLFRIKNYINTLDGAPFHIENYTGGIKKIDTNNASLEMYIPLSGSGGRLVVIDGQHRLYALEHLRNHEKNKVNNISVPVCIIYSPFSTEEEKNKNTHILDVPNVLRKLFVDINSTVEKVSGHYLTLLSDDNLGSIICREFCASILKDDEYGDLGLGVIEWNTKNHKESKTISRKHSTTSIGVLFSALEECFAKNKKTLSHLYNILDLSKAPINNIDDSNDFVSIEERSEFPWRDFQDIQKDWLKEQVNNQIVNGLKRIFFEPYAYQASFLIFKKLVGEKVYEIKSRRDIYTECANYVEDYYVKNKPIPQVDILENKCKTYLSTINDWFTVERENRTDRIFFLSVFQKAYIITYFEVSQILAINKIDEKTRTDIFIYIANKAMDKNLDLFSNSLSYMQGTIFDGARIKANKTASNQLKRLILSLLGDDIFLKTLTEKFSLDETLLNTLSKTGKDAGSQFFSQMKNDKIKTFAKSYKHNFNISISDKRKLSEAEEARTFEINAPTNAEEKLEANIRFEDLVRKLTHDDLLESAKALRSKFNFDDIFYITFDDDIDE